jgi:zinc/manganese transport system substrate-binding protein
MRRVWALLVALVAMLASPTNANADLRVVTSTSELAALVKAIGGKHADVRSLSAHTQDPHFVDAKPSLALELAKADLLVIAGLDLEVGWLPTLLTGARNGKIQPGAPGYLDASGLVSLLEVSQGKVDRSQGDVHPRGSPHYLMDPRRAAKVVAGIAERMAKLDSGRAAAYAESAKKLIEQLGKWQKHWETQLRPLRGKPVVAYHRSFAYLADWLGFDVVAHVEPKPGVPPNPRHVAEVIEAMRQKQIKLIMQESFYPDNTSKLIAEKTSAKLVTIPGGPNVAGGESYIGFVNTLVKRLAAALPR